MDRGVHEEHVGPLRAKTVDAFWPRWAEQLSMIQKRDVLIYKALGS